LDNWQPHFKPDTFYWVAGDVMQELGIQGLWLVLRRNNRLRRSNETSAAFGFPKVTGWQPAPGKFHDIGMVW
jgi:hypothetical protein